MELDQGDNEDTIDPLSSTGDQYVSSVNTCVHTTAHSRRGARRVNI